jgi:hypothetical protein
MADRPTVTHVVGKAIADALALHPDLNTHLPARRIDFTALVRDEVSAPSSRDPSRAATP